MSPVRTHTAEITRPATREHLPDLLAFLDAAAAEAGLDDDVLFPVHLAVEEVCTNVITHGYAGAEPGPLRLDFEAAPGHVAVTLTDEARLFDPANACPPPLTGDAESRPLGGLGWHLVREMVDEIRHEPCPGGGNRVTLVKHLPSTPSAET